MCLVTNTPIPTILDKDLVVYKVLYKLGSRIYSIYQDHRYDIGKIYYDEEKRSTTSGMRCGIP